MKSILRICISIVFLSSLLVFLTLGKLDYRSYDSNDDYIDPFSEIATFHTSWSPSFSTSPSECADFFKVPQCTKCQLTLFSARNSEYDSCIPGNVVKGINDLPEFCSYDCETRKVQNLLENVVKSCKTELVDPNTKDPGNNPKSPESATAFLWSVVYWAAAQREAWCSRNSFGDFALQEVFRQVAAYTRNSTNDQADNFDIDFAPPNAEFHVHFDVSATERHIVSATLPPSIICSESYIKLSRPFIEFLRKHPLRSRKLQKKMEREVKPVVGNLTTTCGLWFDDDYQEGKKRPGIATLIKWYLRKTVGRYIYI